jgi:heme/copper-type cytochrome/quinol oxidase subunit 2
MLEGQTPPASMARARRRRRSGLLAAAAAVLLLSVPASRPSAGGAQDQAPNRREVTITARDYRFDPSRIDVTQDDLVKITVHSADHAYSLTIDEYRVSRRVPAGGSTTLEFRASRVGTFDFYSNLTNDARHARMRGQLVVRAAR